MDLATLQCILKRYDHCSDYELAISEMKKLDRDHTARKDTPVVAIMADHKNKELCLLTVLPHYCPPECVILESVF